MEHLFNEFNPANASEWKARLEKDLKGVTFNDLSVEDSNGITIHPFYTKEDLQGVAGSSISQNADWAICEHIIVEDAETANYQALAALNNGASGLFFFLLEEDVEPSMLLKDIQLPYIYVYFQVDQVPQNFYEKLESYIHSQNWDVSTLNCFLNYEFSMPSEEEAEADKAKLMMQLPLLNQLSIDARLYQNAGANSVTELGVILGKLNVHLDLLGMLDNLDALQKIHVSLSVGTDFFEQIAKLRALRKLVTLLCMQYNLEPLLHVHVETSRIYRSPFDSYSNLLRDTIAGMAAVTGCCDSLYIPPFDEPLRPENKFSKRMSINQQLIFKEESYLNKVADIAAGSFYIETLTEQIAEKAWEQFKAIEKEGGFAAVVDNGYLKEMVEKQAKQLIQDYKDGKKVLIGVNKFPDPNDMPESLQKEDFEYHGIKPIYLFREII